MCIVYILCMHVLSLNTLCMSLSLPHLGVRGVRGISGGKPCLICGHVEDSDPNQSNQTLLK